MASISTILPSADGEAHDGERPSTDRDHHSGCPVHQRGSHQRARDGAVAWLATAAASAEHPRGRRAPGAKVGSQHDVGMEQRDEGVEVTPRAARKKASTTSR